MDIHAGEQVISGVELFAERMWHAGIARPAMRIKLPGGIAADEYAALLSNNWQIYDGEKLMGSYSGYNTAVSHELKIVCMSGAEAEIAQLSAEKDAAIAEKTALAGEISGRVDALAADNSDISAQLEIIQGAIIDLADAQFGSGTM